MRGTVTFSFLSAADVRSPETATAFFDLAKKYLNGASLEKFGDTEPLKFRFDSDLSKALELWTEMMFWGDKANKGYGLIFFGYGHKHSNIRLRYNGKTKIEMWSEYLKRASSLLEADFASGHFFIKESRTDGDNVFEAINSHDIQEAIPSVPWALCLGEPYIKMIGKKKIKSASFYCVEELENGSFYCQLTEDPAEYDNDYESFRQKQETIKQELGPQFFRGAENPVVPKFKFGMPLK